MRTFLLLFSVFIVLPVLSQEQSVLERGADYAVQTAPITLGKRQAENLKEATKAHEKKYTVLATGMHRWEDGKYVACDPTIELFAPNGAIGRNTRHKVIFSSEVTDPEGSIDILTSDDKRLRSRVLGVFYADITTGESVMINELTNSTGTLFPPTTVVYSDAMKDGFRCDLEYENTLAGFEQFLVIKTRPAPPSAWHLDEKNCVVQLLTEFLEAPEPRIERESDGKIEYDQLLDFG